MLVRAPGSTANLGPGFDCLGLALDLPFWFAAGGTAALGEGAARGGTATLGGTAARGERGSSDRTGSVRPDMLVAEATHPAVVAFTEAGGDPRSEMWWRSPIPPGRGLGFSGAARVAGAFAARRLAGDPPVAARDAAFGVAEALEGHGDNAGPSAYGGFVVVADATAVPLEVPAGLCVIAWSPASETSTDASRAALPAVVDLADAKFSVARAALWVAAISSGRTELVAEASRDRLHQGARLGSRPDAAEVLDVFTATEGVLGAWLSGSGPTVAALVGSGTAPGIPEALDAALPPGVLKVLDLDHRGVLEIRPD